MWYPNVDEKTFLMLQDQELSRQVNAKQRGNGARTEKPGTSLIVTRIMGLLAGVRHWKKSRRNDTATIQMICGDLRRRQLEENKGL